MDACLLERDFECRSANWRRESGECSLSDRDRHSVSQSEAGDQQIKSSLADFYGPAAPAGGQPLGAAANSSQQQVIARPQSGGGGGGGLYQNYYLPAAASAMGSLLDRSRVAAMLASEPRASAPAGERRLLRRQSGARQTEPQQQHYYVDLPANAQVDYLENNCVYEPNKLCEFRKIQNRILKTVDSIYQDVNSLEECKQKCLSAPYRCYSFDYGDTAERVCRTSHLDQASLQSVKEPYLEVVGAITYELATCFNVTIHCKAKEMVVSVSSSKTFRGKIYAKSRPTTCANDVREALKFELTMRYLDTAACDVRRDSSPSQGSFSNDIVIQHHDRIVTTQDVGLSVYCQYDLSNKSIATNSVDLAVERIPDATSGGGGPFESKQQQQQSQGVSSASSPITITGLATTVVRSPNVTMRITNMDGQPVTSATVGDRLALLFEIKEKTSKFCPSSPPLDWPAACSASLFRRRPFIVSSARGARRLLRGASRRANALDCVGGGCCSGARGRRRRAQAKHELDCVCAQTATRRTRSFFSLRRLVRRRVFLFSLSLRAGQNCGRRTASQRVAHTTIGRARKPMRVELNYCPIAEWRRRRLELFRRRRRLGRHFHSRLFSPVAH